ncbi:TSUP family transporter [Microvirga antarctica]|uniref:TSUP family transporter n=1 Tax=Microvirga antarctica TaxID=2819233 RepID=UPI001B314887|nr:TSUP family transporter [Microvirga antarctica]
MSPVTLLGFLVLTGAAAYAQTLTGFAFGLITMGGIALTGLLSLPDAAALVSVLTLVNAVQMLTKGWRDVAWREFGLVMATNIPMLVVGYVLLEWLAETRTDILRLILGIIIILSSLQLALRPQPLGRKSGSGSFAAFGMISGLMGGLFSTAGPPLVYHFYRQPMPLASVRETLVTVFALNAVVRISLVTLSGNLPTGSAWWGLLAIPMVMVSTHAARRWPPPISAAMLRRIVFVLLFLSGVSLGAPALVHLLRGAN